MENVKTYVLRGRFQPFCQDHYDSILGFYCKYVKDKSGCDEGKDIDLVLWVVRHLTTTALDAGIKEPDYNKDTFRHISYFNPLRFNECVRLIKRGIYECINSDIEGVGENNKEGRDLLLKFKEWVNIHLHPITVPISIFEMVNFLDAPSSDGGENEKLDVYSAISMKKCVRSSQFADILKNTQPETHKILSESDTILSWEELARTLAARVRDTCSSDKPTLFLPIFDKQDLDDFLDIGRSKWECQPVHLGDIFEKREGDGSVFLAKTKVGSDIPLCAINGYIYYSFLYWVSRSNFNFIDDFGLEGELGRIEKFLERRSEEKIFRYFKARLEEKGDLDTDLKIANFIATYFSRGEIFTEFLGQIRVPSTPPPESNTLRLPFNLADAWKDIQRKVDGWGNSKFVVDKAQSVLTFSNKKTATVRNVYEETKRKVENTNSREFSQEDIQRIEDLIKCVDLDKFVSDHGDDVSNLIGTELWGE